MARTSPTLPERNYGTRKPRSRKKKASAGWLHWWPLLLGIAVTPFAVRAATVMALEGPDSLRMLYPFVLLLKLRALGLPAEMADDLSQLMMYLQFPLYGLFMSLSLRSRGVLLALVQTAVLHFLAVGFLIAIAHM
jgi:hypothetical protein